MAKIIKNTKSATYSRYERGTLGREDASGNAATPALTLEQAREEAESIKAQAREDAERAVREGYEAGWRQGEAAGKEQFAENVSGAVEALRQVAGEVQRARAQTVRQLEDGMVGLSRAVVKRVLRREAWADPAAIRRVLNAVFEHLVEQEHFVVKLHPRDLEAINNEAPDWFDEVEGLRNTEMVSDSSIHPGGCIVESSTMYVDAQIETQLERLLEELADLPCEPPDAQQSE